MHTNATVKSEAAVSSSDGAGLVRTATVVELAVRGCSSYDRLSIHMLTLWM